MQDSIHFFSEEIEFHLDKEDSISHWILSFVSAYKRECGEINFIFCADDYLLELNKEHLSHDFYTDILTFPYSEPGKDPIFSDIYISIDRVKENATTLNVSFEEELHRVMIHGILHLLGYDDHSEEDQALMRKKESEALLLRSFDV
ncbi:MAG: rRNA maturation RNase YbeY [Bacteroidia bacterium]|nr:rRNA maturation RNase YbeY [Bacteroidia bacterium]